MLDKGLGCPLAISPIEDSMHTAPSLDEWRGSELPDRDAKRAEMESIVKRLMLPDPLLRSTLAN
jgi:hypothetical protein